MRDFPIFTSENGVSSIYLKDVPYSGRAYIRIRSASDPAALLEECVSFCRAVDSGSIYAAGHEILNDFPTYTSVVEMRCLLESLPETDAAIFPLQKETLSQWRDLYNQKMANVDAASYLSCFDAEKVLKKGSGYFVHRNGKLLGIGIADGDTLEAVISAVPGAGADVLVALTHALTGESARLEVASTNEKAIRLYERLGFLRVRELIKWHKIF